MLGQVNLDFCRNFSFALRGGNRVTQFCPCDLEKANQRHFLLKVAVIKAIHRGNSREQEVQLHGLGSLRQLYLLGFTAKGATKDLNGEEAERGTRLAGRGLDLNSLNTDHYLA